MIKYTLQQQLQWASCLCRISQLPWAPNNRHPTRRGDLLDRHIFNWKKNLQERNYNIPTERPLTTAAFLVYTWFTSPNSVPTESFNLAPATKVTAWWSFNSPIRNLGPCTLLNLIWCKMYTMIINYLQVTHDGHRFIAFNGCISDALDNCKK